MRDLEMQCRIFGCALAGVVLAAVHGWPFLLVSPVLFLALRAAEGPSRIAIRRTPAPQPAPAPVRRLRIVR